MPWGYSSDRAPEVWTGSEPTREAVIAEARGSFANDSGFWIVEGTCPLVSEFTPDADWVIDDMSQRAYDQGHGEYSEDFPSVSDEAKAELDAFLGAWAEKYIKIDFWIADGEPEWIPLADAATPAPGKEP